MVRTKMRSAVGMVAAIFLCHWTTGDRDVWCRWNTSCVLEAGFPIGDDVVIHWLHLSVPEVYVHSFYHEADQFAYQNKQFMGRTSLFKKKIKQGNASLLLKNVIVEDEGRYKCYVGTHTDATESFIQLHVEAPVTTIQIQKVDKQLICSSERIFPKPELRWSTKPALPHALNTKFQINQESQTQLYDIKGSLDIADDSDSYVEYVCDIRSSRSSKRDTWKKPYPEVWCRWNTSCVLEANFPIGSDVVVHWLQLSTEDVQVHSFYNKADQLALQNERFKGRTSLVKENINKGNASLLLDNVVVADEGTYRCFVGTLTHTTESFLQLYIEAPVTSIQIQNVGNQLICNSEGIFPQPELSWSTKPVLAQALSNISSIHQETRTKLYSINGSLDIASDVEADVEYICQIRSSRSSKRVTWRKSGQLKVVWMIVLGVLIAPILMAAVFCFIHKHKRWHYRGDQRPSQASSGRRKRRKVHDHEMGSEEQENIPMREGVMPSMEGSK